jgi:cytochrome c oxidase subunit III
MSAAPPKLRQPALQEHFEDWAKQEHASRLGMWVFLASELLLFAALFALYATYRALYPADFHAAAGHNSVLIGTSNTVVLITSSFSVAWAIHALRLGRPQLTVRMLALTIALGLVFLALKLIEYAEHIAAGILPGAGYRFAELPNDGARLFFTLYYCMTGLHALHVIAGMAVLTWAAFTVRRGLCTPDHHIALENSGLYWHLVDLIWIYLWPLLYLLR